MLTFALSLFTDKPSYSRNEQRKQRKLGRRRGEELQNKTAHSQCKPVQEFSLL